MHCPSLYILVPTKTLGTKHLLNDFFFVSEHMN